MKDHFRIRIKKNQKSKEGSDMWQVRRRGGKGKEASHFNQFGGREGKKEKIKKKKKRK